MKARGSSVRLRFARVIPIPHVVGSFVTFLAVGAMLPLIWDRDKVFSSGLRNAPLVALYVLLTALWTRRRVRREVHVRRWLDEGMPTERERELALGLPLFLTRLAARQWAFGALLFALFNLPDSATAALIIGLTVLLGGVSTCAVNYLLLENILRPVTARALAGAPPSRPVAPGVAARLTMAWTLATGVPLLGIAIATLARLAGADIDAEALAGAGLFLALLAVAVGLLATVMAAKSVADPLTSVRRALARVEEGDLSARVPVDDGSEVGLVQAGFNRMTEGLAERERLRDLFGRHVGEDVARAAVVGEIRLGGEVREVAVLFVDLAGSTSLAARRPPEEVVELLNSFFRLVVEAAERHGGWVNKFEGDAALCVFGAPTERPDAAGDALAAARELRDRMLHELPELDAGIGVSAGPAVAGNVGAERRFEYTVIGDPVNEAARLCELAKREPDRLLASDAALSRAQPAESERWALGEDVELRGRDAATRLARSAVRAPTPQ